MASKILIPVILAVIGVALNSALKNRDVEVQMIELAVGVLKVDPANTEPQEASPLRDWAIRIIEHYSEVPLNEAAEQLKASPLEAVPSSILKATLQAETIDAEGNAVLGLEVLCSPIGRTGAGHMLGTSPVTRTLYRGLYECWSRDPATKREGPPLTIDTWKNESVAIQLQAPP